MQPIFVVICRNRQEYRKKAAKGGQGMKSYMVGAAALCAVLTVACGDEAQGCHAKQPNPENRGKHLGWFKHDQMPHGRILEKFDKDGDGKLSDEEKAAARQAREERWKALLAEYDKDGDGQLSDEEKAAAKADMGWDGKRIPERFLARFDKDGDGQLSDEEMAAAKEAIRARMEERRKEMLAKYDKDGDGQLSEEEREAARRECGRGKGRGLCPFTSNGPHGNNGVGNGVDPQPAGNPPVINDGEGAGPGNPGAKNH